MNSDQNIYIKEKLNVTNDSRKELEKKLLLLKSVKSQKRLSLSNLKIKSLLHNRLFEKELETSKAFIQNLFQKLIHFALPTSVIIFSLIIGLQVSITPTKPKSSKEALAGVVETQSSISISSSSSSKNDNPLESINDVPFIKQDTLIGSQLASLEMLLKYREINKNQNQILQTIGRSKPDKLKKINNNLVWGDPQEAFVGDPNGNFGENKDLNTATGWGLFDKPLIKFAIDNGVKAENLTNGTMQNLYYELNQKNPVILWLVKDDFSKNKLSVFTSNGTKEDLYQIYSVVVTGYKTNQDGKRTLFVNDPTVGKTEIGEEDLNRFWSGAENRSVVVK